VADHCRRNGLTTIALTGTRFTMSDGFYAQGLESRGLKVITPSESQQAEIHRIIYEELIAGRVIPASTEAFMQFARDLYARGAQTILLGCTNW
jgi:aspartate/glutamate racemase